MGEAINKGNTVTFPYVTLDEKYLFIGRFIKGEDGTDAFFWMDGGIIDSLRAARPR